MVAVLAKAKGERGRVVRVQVWPQRGQRVTDSGAQSLHHGDGGGC